MGKVKVKKADLWRAIRKHCKECSCGSARERALCTVKNCPLYPYRNNTAKTSASDFIRGMKENLVWVDTVKKRDVVCVVCGAASELEVHHVKSLFSIITENNITTNQEALDNASVVWNIDNGVTVCKECHIGIHRNTRGDKCQRHQYPKNSCGTSSETTAQTVPVTV